MDAQKQVITIERHVWTLRGPAHHTEVEKAIAVATHERQERAARGRTVGDVYLSVDDDHIVISFDAKRPANNTRSAALDTHEEARADV
jgi:hypothetical protein